MLLTARYVLPVSSPHIENGAVLVRDDKIVEVGHAANMKKRYPQEETIDFGLAAIMPGFVDAHTHIEYQILRGILNDVPYAPWKAYVAEKKQLLKDEDWLDSAYLGALEVVSSGITTIADITSRGVSAKAADDFGLRSVIYRKVGALEKSHVDDAMERADKDIKAWREQYDSTRMDVGIAAGSLYTCHPEILRAIAAYGADGTKVALHLAGSKEEYGFIRDGSSLFKIHGRDARNRAIAEKQSTTFLPTGVSPVRYAVNWGILDAPEVLAIHCVHVDDSDIKLLQQRNISIAVCQRANAKLSMGIAPVMKFKKAGITVALGTDSPAAADGTDMFEEMRFGLLAQRAISDSDEFLVASDMIRMATIDAARALGIADKVGSLEEGKLADIIAIDLSTSHQVPTHYPNSAVVHTADRDNLLMTMVGGKILYQNEEFTFETDLERRLAHAEDLRIKLRG